MSFPIKKVSRIDYQATERLYLDSTRTKVLKEGDKGAAFLLAAAGQLIPHREVERLGLDKSPEPEAKTVSPEDIKSRATR